MDIGIKLAQLACRHADTIAIVDKAGRWSFRAFHARLTRFGNALAGLGLRRGDRVALLLPDIREYLEVDYGAMAAGFVRVPLDPRLSRAELCSLLRHAGARALVTHTDFAERAQALRQDVEDLRVIGIGGGLDADHDYEELLGRASEVLPPEGDGEAVASYNFSGGTTGAPKAALLRHRNLLAVAQNTIAGFDIRPDSVFLNVRPLWPIAQVILMSYLFAGATVVLEERFDPRQLGQRLRESGATRSSLVPTQLVRWIDQLSQDHNELPRLQTIHVGGSRIPPMVFERALELLGSRIGVLYGMTEAPVTSYLPPSALDAPPERRRTLIGSVGQELFSCEVRIAASEGGADTSDQAGEVLIRGPHVMAGYLGNEALTQSTLREGWLHTGDIGRRDAAGNLHIVGRLSDVIRTGSSSVIPKEVEDVIARHPAVDEVAVIGLPDIEWGESVTAFVVLRAGMAASEHDLVEHCRAHLAGFKKPRSVRFVPSLPRSHYGKVIKSELLGMAG